MLIRLDLHAAGAIAPAKLAALDDAVAAFKTTTADAGLDVRADVQALAQTPDEEQQLMTRAAADESATTAKEQLAAKSGPTVTSSPPPPIVPPKPAPSTGR